MASLVLLLSVFGGRPRNTDPNNLWWATLPPSSCSNSSTAINPLTRNGSNYKCNGQAQENEVMVAVEDLLQQLESKVSVDSVWP